MTSAKEPSLVYRYKNALYVNLTNRCPTACRFCVKYSWHYKYRGYNLKLTTDPAVGDVLDAAPGDLSGLDEAVFCGYGEPTYRLAEMEEIGRSFRGRDVRRVRLNTVGLGSLIHGRDITPDLARYLDAVSVSLNTVDPARYDDTMRPLPAFKGRALPAVLDFIAACARRIPDTVVTAVEGASGDADAVRRAAEERGAAFSLRPFLE
jgi:TatD family-associated radical SAM protein